MLIFVLLSTVLFTTSSKGIGADEESASLLKHGKGESDDTKASVGKSSYRSITITADGQGADLEYEAEQQKKDQERMKGLEKRLEAEGSWIGYGPRPKNYCYIWRSQANFSISSRSLSTDIIPQLHHGHSADLQTDTSNPSPSLYLICGPQRTAYSRQSSWESVFASGVLVHLMFLSHASWELWLTESGRLEPICPYLKSFCGLSIAG